MNYIEKLRVGSREYGSIICMGIDPDPSRIPIEGKNPCIKIVEFYEKIFDTILSKKNFPAAFKPNHGFFLCLDRPLNHKFDGSKALADIINYIHTKTPLIPIILDYKRGDIKNSSLNYAVEGFDCWGADSVTISPYMGTDSISPFIERGPVYILCRTSNRGGADLQNLMVSAPSPLPLYLEVARIACTLARKNPGNVGLVAGATTLEELKDIASYLVKEDCMIPLLIPGVGSQGGNAGDVVKVLADHGYDLSIVRINSSSGINYAWEKDGATDFADAAVREIERLNTEIDISKYISDK